MPEFTVKEVRLPELHLPEIKRDEIVRALSGIRVPEVDLAKVEPRRRLRAIDPRALPWRRQALSGVGAGQLVAAAIAAARIARRTPKRARWSPFRGSRWSAVSKSRDNLIAVVRPAPRRSRRRLAVLLLAITATVAWMLLRSPAFRARLDRAAADARRRMAEMRSGPRADVDLETEEPVSVTATEAPSGDASEAVTTEAVTTEAGVEITEGATNPA
jgi:hypothetical protein